MSSCFKVLVLAWRLRSYLAAIKAYNSDLSVLIEAEKSTPSRNSVDRKMLGL